MKILFLCPHFAEYSMQLARVLVQQAGVSVLLVLNADNVERELDDFDGRPDVPGLQIVAFPHQRSVRNAFSNTWHYWRLIRTYRPDIIHAQEEPKDYLVLPLFLTRAMVVLTVHDPKAHSGDSTAPRGYSRRAWYKRYLRHRAEAAIVHGTRMASDLRNLHFENPIVVAPHGPLGTLNNRQSGEWIAGRCLFFGRMQSYKGLEDFIDAVEILGTVCPGAHGVIAGRGPDLEKFRARLVNHPLFTVMDWFLSPREVVAEFEKANVVVLPYREATQSGVAAYALGSGRPMVVTRVGSLPDMVDNGRNGLIVPPRQPSALAQAMSLILSDDSLARIMGKHSLAIGRGRLSWTTAAVTTVALYDRLLGRKE